MATTEENHVKEINAWRTKRVANLTSDNGWLTLCGLFWLNEGENKIGSASDSVVLLPKAPAFVGSIIVNGPSSITFKPNPDCLVIYSRGSLLSSETPLSHDENAVPTPLRIDENGILSFNVIKRGPRLGVRARDTQNDARIHFKGFDYFPITQSFRFPAKYIAYETPKQLPIKNVLNMDAPEVAPGYLQFEHEGKQYTLDVILESPEDTEYFIIFKDLTCGKESYGMRYLLVPLPKNGETVIDFNEAYNPPCSFTSFATCPVPHKDNVLPFRVEAGEKKYADADH